MFVWQNGELNKEQEDAILDENSIFLNACPGSGKTRTLTYKIAYELGKLKSTSKFIIAITYTNNAANEIKERIERLGVDTSQLWIGTIHAFCIEWILKPYHGYHDKLSLGFKVINAYDAENILKNLCNSSNLYKSLKISAYDCSLIATINGIKPTTRDCSKLCHIERIIVQYFNTLEKNHQIDFEQILFFSYEILKKYSAIPKNLSKLFSYILIDEYQDTKEIQYHIISKILNYNEGKSKIFIVGDKNQAIFTSLGGYAIEKSELEDLLGFKIIEKNLEKNYRSSSKIVEYCNFHKVYTNNVIAVGKNKDYDSLITYDSSTHVDNLVDQIALLIEYNLNKKNIKPENICITAPQWVHVASISKKLILKLPQINFNGPMMTPFHREIENFWFKIARIALTNSHPSTYVKRLRWSKDIINELEVAGIHSSNLTNRYFLKICNSIVINEDDGLSFLQKFFDELLKKLNIEIEYIPLLKEDYDCFFASSKDKQQDLKEKGYEGLDTTANFKKVFNTIDGVNISTIHGIKGEEYDTVIAFALLDKWIPHFSDTPENGKKLFYVLASRARKNLHLISEKGRFDKQQKERTPSKNLRLFNYDYSSFST